MIRCMAKYLLCRLRLHKWDDRENPETHAGYQVCLRCNAYRDRGNAAPGADAAGVAGSSLPAPCDPALSDGDFGGFIYAPLAVSDQDTREIRPGRHELEIRLNGLSQRRCSL